MLTASFGNGRAIAGDSAVQSLMGSLRGGPQLAGSNQVQDLQHALRSYGQAAGNPTAAAVQPTGQVDPMTLMALASIAPQLKARTPGQVPDAVWQMIVQLGGSGASVASDILNKRVMAYAGLLTNAVQDLTYATITGGGLVPRSPRPVVGPFAGTDDPFYKKPWFWALASLGLAAGIYFFVVRK
jgi:hypothetical protein